MSVFDAKMLDNDPDLAMLAAVLHPTAEARAEAIERGRERLVAAPSLGEAMVRVSGGRRGRFRLAAATAS